MFQWWLEMIYRRYLIEADVAYCWKVLKLESSWFDFGFEFGIWINLIPTKMFDQDFTWTSDRCEWVGGSTSSLDIFERSAKMSKDGYESLLVPVSGKLGLLCTYWKKSWFQIRERKNIPLQLRALCAWFIQNIAGVLFWGNEIFATLPLQKQVWLKLWPVARYFWSFLHLYTVIQKQ